LAVTALKTGKSPEFIPRTEQGIEFLEAISGIDLTPFSTVDPDLTFETEFDLTPYGVAGKVIHTPGHSYCSSSVLLDSGEAFVGDMLIDSPFTGEMRLPFLAVDESMLFESYGKLLAGAETFYGGHGVPLSKMEMLDLIRNDKSEYVFKLLQNFK
jgi:hydroxyacylglutathione hydrolase